MPERLTARQPRETRRRLEARAGIAASRADKEEDDDGGGGGEKKNRRVFDLDGLRLAAKMFMAQLDFTFN